MVKYKIKNGKNSIKKECEFLLCATKKDNSVRVHIAGSASAKEAAVLLTNLVDEVFETYDSELIKLFVVTALLGGIDD